MEITRTSAVASYVAVPLISAASRPSYQDNPTLAAGDVKVVRHTGGAWNVANIGTLPSAIAGATRQVLVTLTATELTSDNLDYPIIIQFVDQTATKEWDDQEIVIWTKPAAVNLTQIDGLATSGNNATLNLKQLNIVNSTGDAIVAGSSGSNGRGIYAYGNGTGNGVHFLGGATSGSGMGVYGQGTGAGLWAIGGAGATGDGIACTSQSTNGRGFSCFGTGTGAGFYCFGGGPGLLATGQGGNHGIKAKGGSAGSGFWAEGGASSGDGISTVAPAVGHGLNCSGGWSGASHAINAVANVSGGMGLCLTGSGSGHGMYSKGGSTGDGARLEAGGSSGTGLYALAWTGDAIFAQAATAGNGLDIQGAGGYHGCRMKGGATGDGLHVESGNTSGYGIYTRAMGTTPGNGFSCSSSVGDGFYVQGGSIGVGMAISSNNVDAAGLHVSGGANTAGAWMSGGLAGLRASANVAGGIGILAEGYTTGVGIKALGGASGNGLMCAKGASGTYDLQAAEIQGIKIKTDQLTFTVANKVDATATVAGTPDVNVVGWKGVTAPAMTGDAYAVVTNGTYGNSALKTLVDGVPAGVWAYGSGRSITDKAGFSLSSSQTFNLTGNITGNLSGSVGSVTGAVGSVTGAVGSVVGNVGGSVDSVVDPVTVGTNNDKTGYALTAAYDAAKTAAQEATLGTMDDKLDIIYTGEGEIMNAVAVVDAHVGEVVDVLPTSGRISNFALTDQIDSIPVSSIFEMVMCMANGRFKKDYPNVGDITMYKRDNNTPLFIVHVTETERTRV
jgi:hypothetical protein